MREAVFFKKEEKTDSIDSMTTSIMAFRASVRREMKFPKRGWLINESSKAEKLFRRTETQSVLAKISIAQFVAKWRIFGMHR